jgi:hypothetical protein
VEGYADADHHRDRNLRVDCHYRRADRQGVSPPCAVCFFRCTYLRVGCACGVIVGW